MTMPINEHSFSLTPPRLGQILEDASSSLRNIFVGYILREKRQ